MSESSRLIPSDIEVTRKRQLAEFDALQNRVFADMQKFPQSGTTYAQKSDNISNRTLLVIVICCIICCLAYTVFEIFVLVKVNDVRNRIEDGVIDSEERIFIQENQQSIGYMLICTAICTILGCLSFSWLIVEQYKSLPGLLTFGLCICFCASTVLSVWMQYNAGSLHNIIKDGNISSDEQELFDKGYLWTWVVLLVFRILAILLLFLRLKTLF